MTDGNKAEKLPKVELHIHAEAAIPLKLIKKFAKRNDISLPADLFDKDGKVYFKGFVNFLSVYDAVASVICTTEDLRELTYEYLKAFHEAGGIYSELTISPDHTRVQGISYQDHVKAIEQAIDQARADFGVESRMIVVLVRHFGVESCQNVLDDVIRYPHPYVRGIGLAGNEASHPAKLFVELFEKARKAGLQCTAHAGEWCGPDEVRSAINDLKVTRIGHGVDIIKDEKLLEECVKRQIHLEICLLSNIQLEKFKKYEDHPLGEFYQRGVNFSLNTDDPVVFNTDIEKEYDTAAKVFNLKPEDLLKITENGIRASFAEEALKMALLKQVDAARKIL